jgi:hypothetical protein
MDALIDSLRDAGTTVQALAVSLGGLFGVFATLAVFFAMIVLADKFGKNKD